MQANSSHVVDNKTYMHINKNGHTLYHTNDITDKESNELFNIFDEYDIFDRTSKVAYLTKTEDSYAISIPVKEENIYNLEFHALWTKICRELKIIVFNNNNLKLIFCKNDLNPIVVIKSTDDQYKRDVMYN
jgi:hypothetical protein